MVGTTQNGINILSWTSQYDALKSISVQRSSDSTYNYASIGYVNPKLLKKGPQAFLDGHPHPGKNWYRLYIVFNSDLTWYSNRINLFVDSASLLNQKVLPSNDSLQKLATTVKFHDTTNYAAPVATTVNATMGTHTPANNTPRTYPPVVVNSNANGTVKTTTSANAPIEQPVVAPPPVVKPVLTVSLPDASGIDASTYIRSQYVYTNPFTGHVNVELRDAKHYHYSLMFYDSKNVNVIEILSITQPSIVIDKRNFQHKGLYKFELIRDREKLETGFITIY